MSRSYGTTNAAPYAAAPAVGLAGDTYFNTTSKKLFLSDGTAWIEIEGGGGGVTTSNYYYGVPSGTAAGSNNLPGSGLTQIWFAAPIRANGFTRHANTSVIICDVAGRFVVDVNMCVSLGGTAAGWCICEIRKYTVASGHSAWESSPYVGNGGQAAWYIPIQGTAIFDVAVGDYISVWAQPSQSGVLDGRGTIVIDSVGGTKGDPGDEGIPGNATDVSNFWFGDITGPYTALGNDVKNAISWTTINGSGVTLADSGRRITPALTGRYHITAQISFSSATNAAGYTRVFITHFNSAGAQKSELHVVGNGANAGYYCSSVADGIFDSVVGDYFVISGSINNAAGVFNDNCACTLAPIGGAKGDIGPPGTALGFDGFIRRYTTAVDGSVSLPTGTLEVPLGTVVNAQGATFTPNGANSKFTVPTSGIYTISAQVSSYSGGWPADNVILLLMVNGIAIAREYPKQGFAYQSVTIAIQWYLQAGDQIGLNLYTSGTTTFRAFPGGSAIDPPGPYLSVWRTGSGPIGPVGPSGGPTPTGGTTGQMIVKTSATDFDVAWTPQPGRVAEIRYAGASESKGSGAPYDITGCSVTFTRRSDRRYRAHYGAVLQQLIAVGGHSVLLTDSANTVLDQTEAHSTTGYKQNHSRTAEVTGAAGSVTLKLRMITNGGNIQVINGASPSYIYIEDTGPYP